MCMMNVMLFMVAHNIVGSPCVSAYKQIALYRLILNILGYHWDNCAHCNSEATKCVALHHPGKSSCCHREDCGQSWKLTI